MAFIQSVSRNYPYGVSLVCLLLLAFFVFCGLSESDLSFLFKSDTLYLPSMYKDIYLDGNSLEGWHVNPAPNFFPDMPLFFFLNLCCGSFIKATMFYGIVQVGLTSMLIFGLLKKVSANFQLYGSLMNLMLMSFLLVHFVDTHFGYSFQLLVNGYHFSAFINALFCLNYIFAFLRKQNKLWLFLVVLHGTLSIASDRLFLVTFVTPAFILGLLMLIKRGKEAIWLILAAVLTGYTGLELFKYIEQSGYVSIPDPHTFMDFENIKQSWDILKVQLADWLSLGKLKGWILIGVIASFLLMTIYTILNIGLITKKSKAKPSNSNLLTALLPIFMLVVFVAPILNGSYTGWDTMRYNFSSYIIGLGFLPFAVAQFFNPQELRWGKLLKTVCVIPLVVVIFTWVCLPEKGYRKFVDYCPQRVKALDKVVDKYDLRYGIAPYKDAKVITMFSKNNLRVYTVFDGLTPWFHVTNHNWYYKEVSDWGEDLKFDFVLAKNQTARETTHELLEPILDSLSVADWTLYKTADFAFPHDGKNWKPLLSRSAE